MTDARKIIVQEVMAFADPVRLDVGNWDICTDNIIAALAAAGLTIVPKEPTEKMIRAGEHDRKFVTSGPDTVWRVMVEAANGEA